MLQLAHKPRLAHLYNVIRMMEHRCQASEKILNSQLRSMGSDEEWADYYPNPQENPFEAVRRRLPKRVGDLEPTTGPTKSAEELTDNTIFSDSESRTGHELMPEEANAVANWPKRFTQPYVE